jgi:Tol biopolymer transport system component
MKPHDPTSATSTRAGVGLLLLLGVLLPGPPVQAQEQDPAVLFERAHYEEDVRGDLEAAIRLYWTVVDDHGERRELAARALLGLAGAYELLGREEAREAYRRILTEYGDQADAAEVARERLAALAPEPPDAPAVSPGLEMRRLWTAGVVLQVGVLAPDARRVLFIDWGGTGEPWDPALRGQADVAFYDVSEERAHLVTHLPDQSVEDTYPSVPIWSKDGDWIAYAHWDGEWTHQRLHLVRPDGTENRVLVDNEQFAGLRPLAFSSDRDFVVTLIKGWDDVYRIALVSTDDGDVTILKTEGLHPPHPLSLSPDDRFIVYDQYADGSEHHDIHSLAVDGSREATLAAGPAEEHVPFWTPDGEHVVFLSDRSGRPALWSVPVEEGRATGEPRLVRDNVGTMYPLGFTAEGAFVYRTSVYRTDVFTAELDLNAERLSEPQLLTPDFVGTNMLPAWAPDGERVAFVSRRGALGDEHHLVIRDRTAGRERAHPLPFLVASRAEIEWSDAGDAVYLEGNGIGSERMSYRVDVESGRVQEVDRRSRIAMSSGWTAAFTTERQARYLRSLGVRVAGQGDVRLFSEGDQRLEPGETLLWFRNGVRRFEDGPGREPEALTPLGHAHTWRLSPDGTTLAVAISSSPESQVSDVLYLYSLADGQLREIDRTGGNDREFLALRWSPDGERLLYAEGMELEPAPLELWIVGVDGGEPELLDLELTALEFANMRFRPDGAAIAFTREENLQELWLMDGVEW